MMLIISPKYALKPKTSLLIAAAHRRNIHVLVAKNSMEDTCKEVLPDTDNKYAIYGDSAFAEFMAQEMYLNLYSNDIDWITKIPHPFIKRSVICMTYDKIINAEDDVKEIINKSYLEPIDGEMNFKNGTPDKLSKFNPNTKVKVLVHANVDWAAKFRFIIVNGKIVNHCAYQIESIFDDPCIHTTKYTGRNITPQSFIQTVLDHCRTSSSCIIDVGFIRNVGWGIIGSYPIWSSDIYGCDPDAFLKALFVSCQPTN